ncbi:MAG: TetR/AcrR family transcriptional regulator [Chloroflexi bacterium]|nr:TetR/AcrR family transcriptional regulator [Chloroflexota bacterium]
MQSSPALSDTKSNPRDGRAARSERTRDAVVEALLSLIDGGDLQPTAARIAARAGVSLRSVFQHFEDLEGLYATAADRQLQRVIRITREVRRDGPLDARIAAFTDGRARVLEAISPVRRSALLSEPFSQAIATRLRWARLRGRREVERVFAIELDGRPAAERRELMEALTAASSWSAWEALRTHQSLSLAQARKVMARTLRALLHQEA